MLCGVSAEPKRAGNGNPLHFKDAELIEVLHAYARGRLAFSG